MNFYNLGTALSTSALYMTAGTGAAICMKSGNINLGGEGQIYAGGFVCAIFLDFFAKYNLPAFCALFLSISAAAIISALLSSISVFLQRYKNVNFLLTSFIVSATIIPLIDGLVTGPCRGSTANLLATPFIIQQYRFKRILPPSNLTPYFFVAIIICILAGLWLYKSKAGEKLQVYGVASEFSKYSGFSQTGIELSSAAISGALHGVTGAAAICGTYYSCHAGFYSGIGWNALAVAMIAVLNPYLVIPSSLFMAFVITSADRYALFHNYDFDISGLIQACVLFLISIPFLKGKKFGRRLHRSVK